MDESLRLSDAQSQCTRASLGPVKKVIRICTLAEQDEASDAIWAKSTALERFAAVEAIRRGAWELYGKPEHGLERVLRTAPFPPR